MSDDLFPAANHRKTPIVTGITRSKTELVNILQCYGGLTAFRNGARHHTIAKRDPIPLPRFEAKGYEAPPVEHLVYALEFTSLGNERWAYVVCNGVVVVPPFEFHGWEYLPSQPW